MRFLIKFECKEPPLSVNHTYGQTGNRRFMYTRGKEYKEKISELARKVMDDDPPINGPVVVRITYTFPDKRRRDVTNYDKGILDAMQGIVYHDDTQIEEITLKKVAPDRNTPKTEIEIEANMTQKIIDNDDGRVKISRGKRNDRTTASNPTTRGKLKKGVTTKAKVDEKKEVKTDKKINNEEVPSFESKPLYKKYKRKLRKVNKDEQVETENRLFGRSDESEDRTTL